MPCTATPNGRATLLKHPECKGEDAPVGRGLWFYWGLWGSPACWMWRTANSWFVLGSVRNRHGTDQYHRTEIESSNVIKCYRIKSISASIHMIVTTGIARMDVVDSKFSVIPGAGQGGRKLRLATDVSPLPRPWWYGKIHRNWLILLQNSQTCSSRSSGIRSTSFGLILQVQATLEPDYLNYTYRRHLRARCHAIRELPVW